MPFASTTRLLALQLHLGSLSVTISKLPSKSPWPYLSGIPASSPVPLATPHPRDRPLPLATSALLPACRDQGMVGRSDGIRPSGVSAAQRWPPGLLTPPHSLVLSILLRSVPHHSLLPRKGCPCHTAVSFNTVPDSLYYHPIHFPYNRGDSWNLLALFPSPAPPQGPGPPCPLPPGHLAHGLIPGRTRQSLKSGESERDSRQMWRSPSQHPDSLRPRLSTRGLLPSPLRPPTVPIAPPWSQL